MISKYLTTNITQWSASRLLAVAPTLKASLRLTQSFPSFSVSTFNTSQDALPQPPKVTRALPTPKLITNLATIRAFGTRSTASGFAAVQTRQSSTTVGFVDDDPQIKTSQAVGLSEDLKDKHGDDSTNNNVAVSELGIQQLTTNTTAASQTDSVPEGSALESHPPQIASTSSANAQSAAKHKPTIRSYTYGSGLRIDKKSVFNNPEGGDDGKDKKKSEKSSVISAQTAAPKPTDSNITSSKSLNNQAKADPLRAFFNSYPTFDFDPHSHYMREFQRLCRHKGWPIHGQRKQSRGRALKTLEQLKKEREYEVAREAFNKAHIKAFGKAFGTEADDIEAWKKLCEGAGLEPRDKSLDGYRTVVRKSFINLCDLTHYMRQKTAGRTSNIERLRPTRFKSLRALRIYTIRTELYFPMHEAYADGSLLHHLLRRIHKRKQIVSLDNRFY